MSAPMTDVRAGGGATTERDRVVEVDDERTQLAEQALGLI